MKKLFISLFSLLMVTLSATAQVKPIQTIKVSTPSIQCDMCKNKIETYLKRYDGVNMVTVNVKKKETTVKYLTDRINEEEIKAAIANAGYDAKEVLANPDSYKKLPMCCKKPTENNSKKE